MFRRLKGYLLIDVLAKNISYVDAEREDLQKKGEKKKNGKFL